MSFVDGTGSISAFGERSKTRAAGIALYGYGSGATRGGTAKIQLADGRLIRSQWIATAIDSGYGSGADQYGNNFVFAFGLTPAEDVDFIRTQRLRNRSLFETSGAVAAEVKRLQNEWYFYTAAPRSASERFFRQWSELVADRQVECAARGEHDAQLIAFTSFSEAEAVEQQWRSAMKADGIGPDTIDLFISTEKAKCAGLIEHEVLPNLQEHSTSSLK